MFVVGAPGVGKTTLVRGLLGDSLLFTDPPEPKWTVAAKPGNRSAEGRVIAVAAGWYKGETFDGGDTVPYSGARAAIDFWAEALLPLTPLTILDGARFSTAPSLARIREVATSVGGAVTGVHLVAADADLVARRAARGSSQAPSWIKGATTQARNFATAVDAWDVAADYTPDEVLAEVREVITHAATR